MAWPSDALYGDDDAMVGYLMPRVSLDDYRELVNYAVPITRRPIEEQRGTEFSKEDILDIARNLAGVFLRLHSDNYLIGDVNRANFLVDVNGRIFVIDIDSMQARDPDTGEVHRCAVGTDDFTPPELVGKAFRDFDRAENDDLFGLAVLIFELLMNGVHPYDPIDQTGSQVSGQMRLDNIKRGHSPYASLDPVQALAISHLEYIPDPEVRRSSRDRLMVEIGLAATADFDTILHTRLEPWLDLSFDLRNLFVRAFADSGRDRPSAREWIEAIDRVLRDMRLQASHATASTPVPVPPPPPTPPPHTPPSTGGASASSGGRGLNRWLMLVGAIVVFGAVILIVNSVETLITEDRYNWLWPWVPEPTMVPPAPPPTLTPVLTTTSMPTVAPTLTPVPPNTPMPAAIVPTNSPTPTPTFTPNPTLTPSQMPVPTLIPVPTKTPRPLPTPVPEIFEEKYVLISEGGEPVEISLDWNYGAYGDAIPSLATDDSANLLFPLINLSPGIATITVQAEDDSHVGNGSAMIRITSEFGNAMYLLILEVEDAGEPTATPTLTPTPTPVLHIHESRDVFVAEGSSTNFVVDWNRKVYGEVADYEIYEGLVNVELSDIRHSDDQVTVTLRADDDSLVGNGQAEVQISNARGDMIYTLNVTVVDEGEATATPTVAPTPTITPTVTATPTPAATLTPMPIPLPNLSLEVFSICVERMACWPQTPNEESVSGSLRVSVTWRVANIGSGPTQSRTDLRFYADGEYHEEEYLGYSFDIPILDPGESIGQSNQTLERPDSIWPLDFSLTGDNTIIAIVDMQDRVQEIGDDCRNLKVYRDRSSARNSTCDNVRYFGNLPFLPTPTPTPLFSPTPTPTLTPTPRPTPVSTPTPTPVPTLTPRPTPAGASVGVTVTIRWDMFGANEPNGAIYNVGLCDPSDCRREWLRDRSGTEVFLTWRNDDREMQISVPLGSYTAKVEVFTGNRTARCTTDFEVTSSLDVITTREDCNKAQYGQELKVR